MNKSIYDKLKIIGIKTLRCGTHLFSFFPIKKGRVLLSSYLGESYSCNPKYISEYLQKNYPEKFEIVWAFKDTNKFQDISASKIIKYKSISWFYYTITANVIIGNNAAMWIPRRKGQLIIDTWHGGPCNNVSGCCNQIWPPDAGIIKRYFRVPALQAVAGGASCLKMLPVSAES